MPQTNANEMIPVSYVYDPGTLKRQLLASTSTFDAAQVGNDRPFSKARDNFISRFSAWYISANKESELKQVPPAQYHLVIRHPVIATEGELATNVVEDHINSFLAKLYSGVKTVPLAFRNHQVRIFGSRGSGRELLIGLKPRVGKTVCEHIGSLIRCLFTRKSRTILESISKMNIMGISPVPGTSVERQWNFALLADIRDAQNFYDEVYDIVQSSDYIIEDLIGNGDVKWSLTLALVVELELDLARGCGESYLRRHHTYTWTEGYLFNLGGRSDVTCIASIARQVDPRRRFYGLGLKTDLSMAMLRDTISSTMTSMEEKGADTQYAYRLFNELVDCTILAAEVMACDGALFECLTRELMWYRKLKKEKERKTLSVHEMKILFVIISGLFLWFVVNKILSTAFFVLDGTGIPSAVGFFVAFYLVWKVWGKLDLQKKISAYLAEAELRSGCIIKRRVSEAIRLVWSVSSRNYTVMTKTTKVNKKQAANREKIIETLIMTDSKFVLKETQGELEGLRRELFELAYNELMYPIC